MKSIGPFRNNIALIAPGDKTTLTIWRDGKEQEIELVMGQREPAQAAAAETMTDFAEWGIELAEINDELREQFELRASKGLVVTAVQPRSRAAAKWRSPWSTLGRHQQHRGKRFGNAE